MALLDDRCEFADATALSTAGAPNTVTIGDVYDLGSPGFGGTPNTVTYPGDGTPMYLVITVDTGITAAGAGVLNFWLATAATADVASSSTVIYASPSFTTAASAPVGQRAGDLLVCTAIPNIPIGKRYLGIVQVTTTQAITAGKINAFLVRDPSRYIILPDGLAAGS